MNRVSGTVAALVFVVGAAVAVAPGCLTSPSSVFVKGVLSPPATTTSGSACVFEPAPAGPFISQGVLDVAFASSYQAALLVGSQMIPSGNPGQVRVETNRLRIDGTTVRVTDANEAELSAFTVFASGFVDPASGGQPAFGVVLTTLVDRAAAERLRATLGPRESVRLVAKVAVFGKTLGDESIETQPFEFPLTVCNGCLVQFPPDSVDPVLADVEKKPNCAKAAVGATTSVACFPGQDLPIDCRSCQGNPVCDPNWPTGSSTGSAADGGT